MHYSYATLEEQASANLHIHTLEHREDNGVIERQKEEAGELGGGLLL